MATRGCERVPTRCSSSAWENYPALHAFTHCGLHGRVPLRARELVPPDPWAHDRPVVGDRGRRPDPSTATVRLMYLRRHGPSARAFGVLRRRRADHTRQPELPAHAGCYDHRGDAGRIQTSSTRYAGPHSRHAGHVRAASAGAALSCGTARFAQMWRRARPPRKPRWVSTSSTRGRLSTSQLSRFTTSSVALRSN